LHIQLY